MTSSPARKRIDTREANIAVDTDDDRALTSEPSLGGIAGLADFRSAAAGLSGGGTADLQYLRDDVGGEQLDEDDPTQDEASQALVFLQQQMKPLDLLNFDFFVEKYLVSEKYLYVLAFLLIKGM